MLKCRVSVGTRKNVGVRYERILNPKAQTKQKWQHQTQPFKKPMVGRFSGLGKPIGIGFGFPLGFSLIPCIPKFGLVCRTVFSSSNNQSNHVVRFGFSATVVWFQFTSYLRLRRRFFFAHKERNAIEAKERAVVIGRNRSELRPAPLSSKIQGGPPTLSSSALWGRG
jgi:hypothetical protein